MRPCFKAATGGFALSDLIIYRNASNQNRRGSITQFVSYVRGNRINGNKNREANARLLLK